jgi:acid phosphatase type 7
MRLYAARQGESRKLNAIIRHTTWRRKINKLFRLLTISLLVIFLSQITSDTLFHGSTVAGSVVLVGAGDISSCDNNNDEATAKLLDSIPGTVFVLGDNVYIDGTYSDFIYCYHPTWGRHKNRTKPVPGNHEYFTPEAAGYFNYFNNIPSYYAYDLGDWRIYALNSEIDVSLTSEQVRWLRNDLTENRRLCVLAYWHKPLWSSRYEDGSDAAYETLWKTLHAAGAELVINGHIHNYERFKEMNAEGTPASPGLREIVVGTGGVNHDGYVTSLSTSAVRNASTYGVLKLILNPTSYSWQFIPIAGQAFKDGGSTDCHR